MSGNLKLFIAVLISLVVCGSGFAVATCFVTYKPYGVPDSRRPEYEAIIAKLAERDRLITEQTGPRPRAVVDVPSFDFGRINPQQTCRHRFTIENLGDGPLSIRVEDTSCKCTVADVTDDVVPPGKSGSIEVEWNAGYQSEHYSQSVLVATNDPLTPHIELTVHGEVKAELVLPSQVTFGTVDRDQECHLRFAMHSQLWSDFYVVSATSDLPSFQWNVEPLAVDTPELVEMAAEAKSALQVNVSAIPPAGKAFEGHIQLHIASADGSKTIQRDIKVTGKVRSPIGFYSKELDSREGLVIGTLTNDRDHVFHLLVREHGHAHRTANGDGEPLQVLDCEPKILKTKLEPTSQPGCYRLEVRVPKGTPTTVFNGDHHQGYVQVGSPSNPDLSNWFPLNGAVVEL